METQFKLNQQLYEYLKNTPGVSRAREQTLERSVVAVSTSRFLNRFRIGEIDLISGGEDSAVFCIKSLSVKQQILKLSGKGFEREAVTLEFWYQRGLNVPNTKNYGSFLNNGEAIHFLVIDAIFNQNQLAPNGETYLKTNPDSINNIGEKMGLELAKLHQVRTPKPVAPHFPEGF